MKTIRKLIGLFIFKKPLVQCGVYQFQDDLYLASIARFKLSLDLKNGG